MKILGIYSIVHLSSGRIYIGSSIDVYGRIRVHKWMLRKGTHDNIHLQRAWNMYGAKDFLFTVEEVVKDSATLILREQVWINSTQAANPKQGFNFCPTAGSRLGAKQPKSFGKIIRKLFLGVPKSASHRRKIGKGNRGKIRSEEVKARIAESVSKRHRTDLDYAKRCAAGQFRKGQIPYNKGKKMSAKSRAEMSAARKAGIANGTVVLWNKGRTGVYSKEILEKMSTARRAAQSAETRALMSAAAKARWAKHNRSSPLGGASGPHFSQQRILEPCQNSASA